MEPPPEFSLKEEIEQMREVFGPQQPQPETEWKRGISRHPWVLVSVSGLALVISGALFGRVSDNNSREHEQFRKAIEEQLRWNAIADRRMDSQETRLANYGDEFHRSFRMWEDFQRENYEFWKVAAEQRGDWPTARRLASKLRKLPTPAPAGTPGGQ